MPDVRRVTFNEYVREKRLCIWSFAHRMARIGVWEMEYLDGLRFRERIRKTECIIEHILSEENRARALIRIHEP